MDSKQIGYRIRNVRTVRGLTQDQLVDRYNEHQAPKPLTRDVLSTWERGAHSIPAHAILPLALALDCSVYTLLYDGEARLQNERMVYELSSLSQRLRAIVKYLFTGWQGDVTKAIESIYLYSQCPPEVRAECATRLLEAYVRAGSPNPNKMIPVDANTIVEGVRNLEKW